MNELIHRTEFLSALADYKLSPAALKVVQDTKLVILAGPTSSGRNSIIAELVKNDDFYHIVSDTTRHIRLKNGKPIEKNGREYWFRSETEVLDGLRQGQYMEAAILHNQQVSGCSISELIKANKANKIAVKDIDTVGAHTIHEIKPDTTIIFILPPDFETWMQRLRGRGGIADDEIIRRLKSAHQELAAALENIYYQFVINGRLKDAVNQVQTIAKYKALDPEQQQRGRKLAEKLNSLTGQMVATSTIPSSGLS